MAAVRQGFLMPPFGRLRIDLAMLMNGNGARELDMSSKVTQNPGFGGYTPHLPCLLRRSKLWSTARERLLTGYEVALAMHSLSTLPFDSSAHKDSFLRTIAGNGVHVPTIVAALMWAVISAGVGQAA